MGVDLFFGLLRKYRNGDGGGVGIRRVNGSRRVLGMGSGWGKLPG